MRLGVKFSIITIAIVLILSVLLEFVSLRVFSSRINELDEKLFRAQLDALTSLAYEQDELFFEGVYAHESEGQSRVIDTMHMQYREAKDPVTFAFIVDTNGAVVVHPAATRWGEAEGLRAVNGTGFFDDSMISIIREQKRGEIEYTNGGIKKWCMFTTYEPWNWVFCMTTSMKNKNRAVVSFVRASMGISALVVIGSVLLVWVISYRFVQPLHVVIEKLRRIATGETELIESIDIKETANDEIGMLANAVNTMAQDLSRMTVSKHFLDNILQCIVETLVVTSPGGTIVTVNPAVTRLLGYREEELIGGAIETFFMGGVPFPGVRWNELVYQGEICDKETRYVAKDGRSIPVAFSVSFQKDEDGQVKYVVCTARDITEHKKSETDLYESRRMLQLVLDTVPQRIFWKDRQYRYLGCNKNFAQDAGGAHPRDIVGKTDYDLAWKKDEADFFRVCDERIMQEGKAEYHIIEPLRQADGTDSWAETNKVPLHDAQGNVVGVLGTYEDITARKRAEDDQLRLEKEIAQSQKLESIGTLAAGVAHEINTPIQFIGDNTRFIADVVSQLLFLIDKYHAVCEAYLSGNDVAEAAKKVMDIERSVDISFFKEEIPAALRQTQEGVQQVARIVSAMKDFSHTGSEKKQAEDINKAIETTVIISHNEWKYAADLTMELDPALPLVECFIGSIKQVILNVIINATHAIKDVVGETPEHMGRIRVRTYQEDNAVIIAVGDTGKGIPEHVRDKVFDHFFTTKQVGAGTGQGLSMAYQTIVEKHGGKIWFDTEVGKGTTFFISLPIF